MSRVCPRLQSILPANRRRKTTTPLVPRIRLHYLLNRRLVDQFWVEADVVVYRSELYQRSNGGDSPRVT